MYCSMVTTTKGTDVFGKDMTATRPSMGGGVLSCLNSQDAVAPAFDSHLNIAVASLFTVPSTVAAYQRDEWKQGTTTPAGALMI